MNIKKIMLLVNVIFFCGCSATKLMHQPEIYTDTLESRKIIERALHHQSANHTVKSVNITSDYIKVINSIQNRVTFIHYEYIHKIDLHEKNEWKIVTIRGPQSDMIYRLYVTDEQLARDFINALYTLKDHQHDIPLQAEKPMNYKQLFLVEDLSKRLISGFNYCKNIFGLNATEELSLCIETVKETVFMKYNEVTIDLESNTNALDALKNFYIYWVSSLNALIPVIGESKVLYRQRIYEHELGLLSREKEFKIEVVKLR